MKIWLYKDKKNNVIYRSNFGLKQQKYTKMIISMRVFSFFLSNLRYIIQVFRQNYNQIFFPDKNSVKITILSWTYSVENQKNEWISPWEFG